MAPTGEFKVIIAGGGVAGLTIANMLEKFELDYVLLEAHADISPAVGASIGMFANGLRILDQIGCFEKILKLPQEPIECSHIRNSAGKDLAVFSGAQAKFVRRHGYATTFFDRQWLLGVLYDNLQHKERVLVNKKVVQIHHAAGGVDVITEDGDKFRGTFVLGADGIHSTVRDLMTRMAHQQQPGYFDPDEALRVPCYYRCSFGIAHDVPGLPPGQLDNVMGNGYSELVISGPEKRIYWFIFEKLPEPKFGKDIPRYTKEDEVAFAKKYRDLPITDKVTFGQVYSKRLSSTLTPLHEVVYEKWFYRRIITLGDSAHKPNPISGQGGNGAIESVAELVNAIVDMKESRSGGLDDLNEEEVLAIFRQTQSARHAREKMLVARAHEQQALSAYENPLLSSFMWNVVTPLAGEQSILNQYSTPIVGAARLKRLPVPQRAREIPFDDELPAKTIGEETSLLVKGIFAAGATSLVWAAGKSLHIPVSELRGWAGLAPIAGPWAGSGGDSLLSKMVSFTSYALHGGDVAVKAHYIYFLSQIVSPVLMWTINGYRRGSQGTLLALPSVFLGAGQIKGVGYIAPLYAAISAFHTNQFPPDYRVPAEAAQSLLPALTLGYAIPTILMLVPTPNIQSWQDFTALAQLSPLLVPGLTWLFSAGKRWWTHSRQHQTNSKDASLDQAAGAVQQDPKEDASALRSVYTHAFAIQAASHVAVLAYSYFHPGISMTKMFFDMPGLSHAKWNLPDTGSKVAAFLKYDLMLSWITWAASSMYSVWELRRHGYVRSRDAVKGALGVLLGQLVVGPGATWTGVSYWQDRVVSEAGRARRE